MALDGSSVTVSIRVGDWYKLPYRIQHLVQTYTSGNPWGIPKNGVLTVTMAKYRWDEIQEAMRALEAK